MFAVPISIGFRYVRSRRRSGFVTFVSAFAMLGMALGVFALIVVMSVMNGFDKELKQRILRVVPHAFVSTSNGLREWRQDAKVFEEFEHVIASSPYISGPGLISQRGQSKGAEIIGVLPEQERRVSEVDQFILLGEMEALNTQPYGIVLGSLLARSLGVTIGDRVVVTLPEISITPAGVFPRTKRFTLVAVFEVGHQVDQNLALIHLDYAQKLFRRGKTVDGLRLKFDEIYSAPEQLPKILNSLGGEYEGSDWSQTQGSLFEAVKLEKTVTGLLLGIIIAVAAFNIVTTLVMMVTEKRSDIAVLRTLGLTRKQVIVVFMTQGAVTGIYGVVLGAVLGIPVAIFMPELISFFETLIGFEIFDPNVYFVTQLPSDWRIHDTIQVCIVATIISILATVYPAYRASKIEPAEALRYDS